MKNKVIASCVVNEKHKRYKCEGSCSHAKPHKKNKLCLHDSHTQCDCIPVPFEYYIKEILNEKK